MHFMRLCQVKRLSDLIRTLEAVSLDSPDIVTWLRSIVFDLDLPRTLIEYLEVCSISQISRHFESASVGACSCLNYASVSCLRFDIVLWLLLSCSVVKLQLGSRLPAPLVAQVRPLHLPSLQFLPIFYFWAGWNSYVISCDF